ncbi:uncharacterized protein VTP21DRAFT_2705 [Calcarisporiella thermophila]|uniref:uncharacterized protein n=1 Tax=Calcarisporiella thermophila TaxID=911321 RepID=UPI00374298B5
MEENETGVAGAKTPAALLHRLAWPFVSSRKGNPLMISHPERILSCTVKLNLAIRSRPWEKLQANPLFAWYRRPLVQVSLLGFIFFTCPGLFNAINGMGAAGQLDENTSVVSTMNACLYAFFAVIGFVAGGINNLLGPRLTIFLSGWGYVFYIGALYDFNMWGNPAVPIAAGAVLGIAAGCIWAAQGAIMMSYPDESSKGRYIAVFWSIFNWGAVLGNVIVLGMNANSQGGGGVSTATYIAFMVLMGLGSVMALAMVPPRLVQRKDGSRVMLVQYPDWRTEAVAIAKLVLNRDLMLLFPAFFYSNFFYTYQFGFNAYYFSVRTRALNSLFYWLMQILASIGFGWFLDWTRLSRRTRAFAGLAFVFTVFSVVWGGGLAFQLTSPSPPEKSPNVDWTDGHRFGGPFVLFMLYGACDAFFQVYCYWIMGALTNDPLRLSRYAGFYKGVQSAGAAVSWGIGSVSSFPFWGALALNWSLLVVSTPLVFIVCRGIKNTNYGTEDFEKNNATRGEKEKMELPNRE